MGRGSFPPPSAYFNPSFKKFFLLLVNWPSFVWPGEARGSRGQPLRGGNHHPRGESLPTDGGRSAERRDPVVRTLRIRGRANERSR